MVFNYLIGYYVGQVTYLTPLKLIAVSFLYNYFADYEIPYNSGNIEKV